MTWSVIKAREKKINNMIFLNCEINGFMEYYKKTNAFATVIKKLQINFI